MSVKKFLVVGAGFSGAVTARQLADAGFSVTVIDKRPHIAGNAYDHLDEHGVLVHKYGPHIFHTNSKRVFQWLSQFTDWRFYEHRVLAQVNQKLYPIPINRTTINELYGLQLSEAEVESYLKDVSIKVEKISTSEDVVLSSVGTDLCEKFFRGYTRKQWGLDLSQLSAGVAARIPTRSNSDDRYFSDEFQFMPAAGYSTMFARMLESSNIKVELGKEFNKSDEQLFDGVVYTGPIDQYFDYCYGKLPYRSLSFKHQHHPEDDRVQQVGTINFPNDYDYTRITEFKHLTGQKINGTSVVYEFPTDEGDPYYPIPRPENNSLYDKYRDLAESCKSTYFVGRLAQYKYYNMDQVVGAALELSSKILAANR
ncbi:UDP-galactopyranose mutase [Pseudacidovorax sp. NFM-22]|uniref:UDP-galactopyranose mutase n=1 Tax=Pseudacidovorax sp. NFM-22 TaxID=2744469 RepID=UPI001F2007DC|nr:UDP-galactopyranose mutase [Pseudacidovorax sp. NFM-22]